MRRHLSGWPARLAPHLLFLIPELLIAAGPFVISSGAKAGDRGDGRPPSRVVQLVDYQEPVALQPPCAVGAQVRETPVVSLRIS